MPTTCPCGSRALYADCCGQLHRGAPAPTAERLMRSRFTAFALSLEPYLLETWHPSTRPAHLDLDETLEWRRLQIVDAERGGEADAEGVVEFRASFRGLDGAGLLHERSRFTRGRTDHRWLYLDGDVLED